MSRFLTVVKDVSIPVAALIVSVCSFRAEENNAILGIEQKRFELDMKVVEWQHQRCEPFDPSQSPAEVASQAQRLLISAHNLKKEGELLKEFTKGFNVSLPSRFYESFQMSSKKTTDRIEQIDTKFLDLLIGLALEIAQQSSTTHPFVVVTPADQSGAIDIYKALQTEKATTVSFEKNKDNLQLITQLYLSHLLQEKYGKEATASQLHSFSFPKKIDRTNLIDYGMQFYNKYVDNLETKKRLQK